MSAWSHLPNAAHIDRVLASVKANPKIWADAWDAVRKSAYDADWDIDWDATYDAAHDAALDATYDATHGVTSGAAWDAAKDAAYYAAIDAITALFAYDDAAKYLDLPLDQLQMLYALTEHPAALLLQPAVLAFDMERALA